MTENEFWDHIDATRKGNPDAHSGRLTARLAKLPPGEVVDFDYWWDAAKCRAYRRDLWGAAYTINGGCSDDGFTDFRTWLILQGRAVYDAAVADPDSLADVLDGEEVCDECYPGLEAWFAATGAAKDDAGYAAYDRARSERHPDRPPLPPLAPRWDFDDAAEVRRRFPRLAALYLDNDDD